MVRKYLPGRLVPMVLAALAPILAHTQDMDRPRPVTTQELWASFSVKGRPPVFLKDMLGDRYKRILLSGEVGYRSADNFFAGRQIYTDLGVRYKVNRWLAAGAEYRYAARISRADRQRTAMRLHLNRSWGRFDLDHRLIWQRNHLDRDRTRTLVRNRIRVAYDFRSWKLDPELSVEFFTRTDLPRGWTHIGTRYKLATSYTIRKGHRLGPAIVHDRDGRVNDPRNRVIWSLDYTMDLRRL